MLKVERLPNTRDWSVGIQLKEGLFGVLGSSLADTVRILSWRIMGRTVYRYFGTDFQKAGDCMFLEGKAEEDAELRGQIIGRLADACRNGDLVQIDATNWEAPENPLVWPLIGHDTPILVHRAFEGSNGAEELENFLKTYYPCSITVSEKITSEETDKVTVGLHYMNSDINGGDWLASIEIKFNDGTCFYNIKPTIGEIARELENYISDQIMYKTF